MIGHFSRSILMTIGTVVLCAFSILCCCCCLLKCCSCRQKPRLQLPAPDNNAPNNNNAIALRVIPEPKPTERYLPVGSDRPCGYSGKIYFKFLNLIYFLEEMIRRVYPERRFTLVPSDDNESSDDDDDDRGFDRAGSIRSWCLRESGGDVESPVPSHPPSYDTLYAASSSSTSSSSSSPAVASPLSASPQSLSPPPQTPAGPTFSSSPPKKTVQPPTPIIESPPPPPPQPKTTAFAASNVVQQQQQQHPQTCLPRPIIGRKTSVHPNAQRVYSESPLATHSCSGTIISGSKPEIKNDANRQNNAVTTQQNVCTIAQCFNFRFSHTLARCLRARATCVLCLAIIILIFMSNKIFVLFTFVVTIGSDITSLGKEYCCCCCCSPPPL